MFRQKIKEDNPSTVPKAVQQDPSKFKDAPTGFKKDREIVLAAVEV